MRTRTTGVIITQITKLYIEHIGHLATGAVWISAAGSADVVTTITGTIMTKTIIITDAVYRIDVRQPPVVVTEMDAAIERVDPGIAPQDILPSAS